MTIPISREYIADAVVHAIGLLIGIAGSLALIVMVAVDGEFSKVTAITVYAGGLIEMLFLENCNQFADLVRTGNLDFYLLQPIDEQFLVSCRTFDWSCAPNLLMGAGIISAVSSQA